MPIRTFLSSLVPISVFLFSIPAFGWQAQPPRAPLKTQVYSVNTSGVSRPLRDLPANPGPPRGRSTHNFSQLTRGSGTPAVVDQVTQGAATLSSPGSTSTNFEGISVDANSILLSPPDENLAVGPNHIVQTVNMVVGVFDKSTGAMAPGYPKPINSLYPSGACATQSQSDPIVRYDRQADRWIISYVTFDLFLFYIDDSHICLAVSQTGDPTGAYYLYDVDFGGRLQDYQKFAVWPDGWYMSANSYPFGLSLEGSNMCAWERSKLLVGDTSAMVICVVTGDPNHSGLLPSDWDGATAPPAGAPNYFVEAYSTTQLGMFRMKPNYLTPASTQVTGPIYIPVSSFNVPCGDGGDCIPQKGTTQLLASVGERLMYRLAYRNFGTHESLVVNHSVATNNTVGIRWYELRDPGGATPTVYQQSTYAPDSDYRWMGSATMDKFGNLAIGYSKSGTALFPGIFYTGRGVGDPLNTLGVEQMIWAGSGSQLPGDGGSDRWGDYSSIETDPVDDCTIWYTSEYLASDGTFNWRTRIAAFKFPACVGGPPRTDTTTAISSHLPSPSVTGQAYSVAVTVSPSGGSGTPTGSVHVVDGAGASCDATLSSGSGSCQLTANTAVARTLTATYGGDSSFNGSTSPSAAHTVNKASTTTTINSDTPDPSDIGQAYTVSFSVTVNSPGAGTPTGLVTVSDGAGGACSASVAAGSCSLTSTTGGAKTLSVVYPGDSNFNLSSATTSHTVNSGASIPAAPTALTATKVFTQQGKKTVLSRIDLTFQDNANDETDFLAEQWRISGKGRGATCALFSTFTIPAKTGTGTVNYSDSTASSSTCRYRVAARNGAGPSAYVSVNVP